MDLCRINYINYLFFLEIVYFNEKRFFFTIQDTQPKFPDKHLGSNGETGTSVRTNLGNPLAHNEDHSQNVGTSTTEKGEKEKNDNGKNTEDGDAKDKDSVEDLEREGGVRDERREDGNKKRKKEEEDEGGGLKRKEVRKENVTATEEKTVMKDGEERKKEGIGHNKIEAGRKEYGSGGEPGQEIEEQINDIVGKSDGVGNQAGKEDGVAGREKKGEVGNEKNRDEMEDEKGRPRSDPLLRSSETVQKDKNQKKEQNVPTSQKTGQHTDDTTANKTKEVHALFFF